MILHVRARLRYFGCQVWVNRAVLAGEGATMVPDRGLAVPIGAGQALWALPAGVSSPWHGNEARLST
jgi:hypothetical protein